MADVKIQDLLTATTVADTNLFIVEDNADTKKITRANLRLNLMTFPATQVPSSDPNTLDDYEEGTWAPEVIGATTAGVGTYTDRLGWYTKIGNVVHFNIYIVWSTHTGTGFIRISLPPFTSISGTFFPLNITPTGLNFTNQLSAMVVANSQFLQLYTYSAGGSIVGLNMDTAAAMYISGSYITS